MRAQRLQMYLQAKDESGLSLNPLAVIDPSELTYKAHLTLFVEVLRECTRPPVCEDLQYGEAGAPQFNGGGGGLVVTTE